MNALSQPNDETLLQAPSLSRFQAWALGLAIEDFAACHPSNGRAIAELRRFAEQLRLADEAAGPMRTDPA